MLPIQSKGCLTARIDKSTTIWCLGHLASHIDMKVDGLKEAGFANAKPMYCQEQSAQELKDLLAASPGSLLYVGGAMMKTHPELMADLFTYVEQKAPLVAIEVLGMKQFDQFAPGHTTPPSVDDVARVSVLHVAQLAEAWAARP
jgi:hypothetical protein